MQVKTKNLLVGALAAALILMLWYRVGYAPAKSQASKANSAAQELQTSANAMQRQLDAARGSDKKKTNEVSQADLARAIPVEPELSSFLRQADSIRAASQVDWQSITPASPTLSNGVETVSVGITVQGSYAQIANYMTRLEGLKQRIFVADNVSVTATAADNNGGTAAGQPTGTVFAGMGGPPKLQVQITGRIFSQAPPGAATVGAGTGAAGAAAAPAPAAP